MKYTLRPYQQEAVDAALADLNKWRPALIVAPTWAWKSLIVAGLLEKLEWHTIVFQPSKEILEQNYEKFVSCYGDSDVAIYSASMGTKEIAKVTFATIGSVKNHMDDFKHFDNVIIDEVHWVNSEWWMYKDFIKMLWTRRLIWLTATPYRMHSSMMWASIKILTRTRPRIFDKISYVIGMDYMVENWYLIKPTYYRVPWFDSSKLKSNSNWSEYSDASIREYFQDIRFDNSLLDIVKRLVNKWRKWILVFTYSVEDAHFIAEQLGDIACVITGADKKKDREEKVSKFKSWEYTVALNFGTMTTWFDYPALDTVVIWRPTKSVALYYQMLGRVLRQYPDKDWRIVDMCDNVDRMWQVENYKLVDPWGWNRYLHNGKRMLTWVFI